MKNESGAGVSSGLSQKEGFTAESAGPSYTDKTQRPKSEKNGKAKKK